MAYDPGAAWVLALSQGGYENHCRDERDLKAIKRIGLAWRRILAATGLSPALSAFEIDCGGGEKLAPLALNGAVASGIDVSPEVIDRAHRYFTEIEAVSGAPLGIDLVRGDFFDHKSSKTYDLVYHFGVVEHYLDANDRAMFWQRAIDMTSPGGWVVSVVPCGRQLMRAKVREQELCGYRKSVAEIDYSSALHVDEFRQAGLDDIRVMPHAYFYFLNGHPNAVIRKIIYPMLFIFGNALLLYLPLPVAILERFAHTLIVVGRKPEA